MYKHTVIQKHKTQKHTHIHRHVKHTLDFVSYCAVCHVASRWPLFPPVWKCRRSSVSYSDLHSNIRSSDSDIRSELRPRKPPVWRAEGASLDAPWSLTDRQAERDRWERDGERQTERQDHPFSPWAGMSIMAYGNVREITSCMMIEKLKTSPANEPPRIEFLRSSGADHSSSERQTDRERERQVEKHWLTERQKDKMLFSLC